jgi:hypothetical protein
MVTDVLMRDQRGPLRLQSKVMKSRLADHAVSAGLAAPSLTFD